MVQSTILFQCFGSIQRPQQHQVILQVLRQRHLRCPTKLKGVYLLTKLTIMIRRNMSTGHLCKTPKYKCYVFRCQRKDQQLTQLLTGLTSLLTLPLPNLLTVTDEKTLFSFMLIQQIKQFSTCLVITKVQAV